MAKYKAARALEGHTGGGDGDDPSEAESETDREFDSDGAAEDGYESGKSAHSAAARECIFSKTASTLT